MNRAAALLELRGVRKAYPVPGGGPGSATKVLRGVDLTIAEGESVAVLGPSGCGKSTLLNVIATLETFDAGEVLWRGEDVGRLSESELDAFRGRRIGLVFQHHHLLPQCTALENVLVPTLNRRDVDRSEMRERAEGLLDRVGLAQRASHRPAQLSGGERQRVAVVRALIQGPELLLADEPTGSLDAERAQELGALLVELNREDGVALCVVTHSEALAERMDRRLRLEAGRILSPSDTVRA